MPTKHLRLLKEGIDLNAGSDGAPSHWQHQALVSLRREHHLILQAAGEGIYGLDLEGRAIFVNPAAAAMTGHTADELLGRSMHEVVHHSHPGGDHYERADCPIYAAIRDGMVRKSGDEVFWRNDGSSFPVEYTSTPILEGKKVVGAVVVFRDVSNRQATENRLRRALDEVRELKERLQEENRSLKQRIERGEPLRPILGSSAAVKRMRDLIRRAAATDVPVLVQGESGTGKELVCRALHELGSRKEQPFVSINCAAIAPTLIESELFGHEKGAFTGAFQLRAGSFEQAGSGTLLLDEVGELPLDSQAKLLRVLQERTYRRVGGERQLHADARIVAATNRDLRQLVRAGRFRADLYYRLYVLPIDVPPLRERRSDIDTLAEHFRSRCEHKWQRRFCSFESASLERLRRHDWPGNVRELEHTIERAVLLCDGPELVVEELSPAGVPACGAPPVAALPDAAVIQELATVEREHILRALESAQYRVSGPRGAALRLGLHPNTLRYRMAKLGITKQR